VLEIKWNDKDPETDAKRYLRAERFAKQWRFAWRTGRFEQWQHGLEPTLEMWEHIYETLERRYRRRDGVHDEDIAQVKVKLDEARRRAEAEKY
jgi:hypothetical protein